jgi:hypothetical protein
MADLSPSVYLNVAIGFLWILHLGKKLLRLTANAIHKLLVGIGNPVALHDQPRLLNIPALTVRKSSR